MIKSEHSNRPLNFPVRTFVFGKMDRSALSTSAIKGLFLGSNEKFIVGGNSPNANVQILQTGSLGAQQKYNQLSNLFLNGVCTDLELCGVPRLAQTFAAVSSYSENAGSSSISMLNVDTAYDSATLTLQSNEPLFSDTFNITSVSFCSDLELMAVGTEAGTVTIIDLYSGNEVSRVKVDPCGVAKVKFTRTGQLVTVGESSKSQIKIWDLKASAVGSSNPVMVLSQQMEDENSPTWQDSSGTRARRSATTCVGLHPVQEKLVSGTSQGVVQVWDLRSAACLSFSPHGLDLPSAGKIICSLGWVYCQQFFAFFPSQIADRENFCCLNYNDFL